MVNLHLIETTPPWRVGLVALIAKALGITVKIDGIPFGSRRRAMGEYLYVSPPRHQNAVLRALVRDAYFAGWSDCCVEEGSAYYCDLAEEAWARSDIPRAMPAIAEGGDSAGRKASTKGDSRGR